MFVSIIKLHMICQVLAYAVVNNIDTYMHSTPHSYGSYDMAVCVYYKIACDMSSTSLCCSQ